MATIAFTKLTVSDINAMCAFYCDVFQLQEQNRFQAESLVEKEPVEEVILISEPPGAVALILITYLNGGPAVTGETCLGLMTQDIEGDLERLIQNGGQVTYPASDIPIPGMSGKCALATDPEGHKIEIIQMG